MDDTREYLLEALAGSWAHGSFQDAVANWPPELRGVKPPGAPHSAWELLDHLQLTLEDMVDFSRDPNYASRNFPEGYWPATATPPNHQTWDESVRGFESNLEAMKELVRTRKDLMAPYPEGSGKPLFRNVLVMANHNSYHLGQLFYLRKTLGIPS